MDRVVGFHVQHRWARRHGPRLLLTLDEVDVLLSRSAELEETELLLGLERRLDQVLRRFAAE